MTEQSPTAAFTASSFLDGANADYVDQLAARQLATADPAKMLPPLAGALLYISQSGSARPRAVSTTCRKASP